MYRQSKPDAALDSSRTAAPVTSEAGLSLIEVLISLTLLALGAMASMAAIGSAGNLDTEVAERRLALRAAQALVQEVTNYDYGDDVAQLVAHWSAPENRALEVPALPAAGAPTFGSSAAALPVMQGSYGATSGGNAAVEALLDLAEQQDWTTNDSDGGRAVVAIDDGDPERIIVAVRVRWGDGKRARSLQLQTLLSEIRP